MKLEYKVLKEKVKEINKKDAQFYGNMFAKLNKLEPFDTDVSLPFLLLRLFDLVLYLMVCNNSVLVQKSDPKEAEPMVVDSKA